MFFLLGCPVHWHIVVHGCFLGYFSFCGNHWNVFSFIYNFVNLYSFSFFPCLVFLMIFWFCLPSQRTNSCFFFFSPSVLYFIYCCSNLISILLLPLGSFVLLFSGFFRYQFTSVQSLSRVWLFATPWSAARQASLSITNSRSLPKLRYRVRLFIWNLSCFLM